MVDIIQAGSFPEAIQHQLNHHFKTHVLSAHEHFFASNEADKIRGIAVRHYPLDKGFLSRLPHLEVISSYSAGLDNVDLAYCHSRGIQIYNTSSILANDVADLAISLALTLVRKTFNAHQFIVEGKWLTTHFPLTHSFSSLKIGIVGLGHVGHAIAKRCQVMGSEIAYFSRSQKDTDYLYYSDIEELARWADLLFVCCALTKETQNLINQNVLDTLGCGFLVNIARGEIIDEQALINALAKEQLSGVALDVFTHEPKVPTELRNNPRVVLSPHLGSATLETRKKMGEHVVQTLVAYFLGNTMSS